MATELKVAWGPRKDNVYLGKEIQRLDGIEKATGAAKFAADANPKDCLFAKVLAFKGGAGKVKSLNLEEAKKVPGVKAVHAFVKEGDELQWDGALVAAVAAERQEQAEDGIRAIKFTFDATEHFVDEDDLKGAEAAKRTKDLGNNTKGDVEAALKSAAVVHKGYYGIATISHMCLETHGSCTRWEDGKLIVNHSTQNVSGTPANFVSELQKQHNISVDAADVTVLCQFVGGGFGSK
ncbi:MAG: xanthine dehydrogenase YagR molybdenum-binding subunit, partial [Planctomycetota bacterium]